MMTEPTRFRRSRGIAGPTLACLLGAQFHALKYGDRFYFETRDRLEGFTAGEELGWAGGVGGGGWGEGGGGLGGCFLVVVCVFEGGSWEDGVGVGMGGGE